MICLQQFGCHKLLKLRIIDPQSVYDQYYLIKGRVGIAQETSVPVCKNTTNKRGMILKRNFKSNEDLCFKFCNDQ